LTSLKKPLFSNSHREVWKGPSSIFDRETRHQKMHCSILCRYSFLHCQPMLHATNYSCSVQPILAYIVSMCSLHPYGVDSIAVQNACFWPFLFLLQISHSYTTICRTILYSAMGGLCVCSIGRIKKGLLQMKPSSFKLFRLPDMSGHASRGTLLQYRKL